MQAALQYVYIATELMRWRLENGGLLDTHSILGDIFIMELLYYSHTTLDNLQSLPNGLEK